MNVTCFITSELGGLRASLHRNRDAVEIDNARSLFGSSRLGVCFLFSPEYLHRTFTSLGYQVHPFLFPSAEEIIKILHRFAGLPQHRDYDSFACVLVSRGGSQRMMGVDQAPTGFSLDYIKSIFMGDACSPLRGKPKLFFIQSYEVLSSQLEDSSLEVDGPAVRSLDSKTLRPGPCMVHREADIFWSLCTADVSQVEQPTSSSSVYLQNLSRQLEQER